MVCRQKCGSTYKSKALFCSLGEDNGETERRVLFHVYWCSLSKREESANIFRFILLWLGKSKRFLGSLSFSYLEEA